MDKAIDMTGQKIGHWTVIKRVENYKNGTAQWLCKCDCGNTSIIFGSKLRSGKAKGCIHCAQKTHGFGGTRIYNTYCNMKKRCYFSGSINFKDYGGRGITICNEWLEDFMNFYNWAMANGYDDSLTIDRIDVNGNYEPSNCRWVTAPQQRRNKRTNHYITINGVKKPLYEWCNIYGIYPSSVYRRIDKGWDEVKAITYPRREWKKPRKVYGNEVQE